MTVVAFALVVLIIVILACWAVDQAPGGFPYGNLIKLIVIIVGVLAIAHRAGLL